MSFITTHPEILNAAAGSLSAIGTGMATEVTSTGPATVGVIPPAADPISIINTIHLIDGGVQFQQVHAAASMVHQQIVSTLAHNATGYDVAEAANAIATSI